VRRFTYKIIKKEVVLNQLTVPLSISTMLAILKTETCLTVVMRTSTKPTGNMMQTSGPKWIPGFPFEAGKEKV
jgi:hypothetical protein